MNLSSKKRLEKVHPLLANKIEKLLLAMKNRGFILEVTQGLRTFAEQDALFAQGRTRKGPIVTKARGGQSNHNYGFSSDIALMVDGKYTWPDKHPMWKSLSEECKLLGLDWGGNWKFVDKPHVQLSNLPAIKTLLAWYKQGGLELVWKNTIKTSAEPVSEKSAPTKNNLPIAEDQSSEKFGNCLKRNGLGDKIHSAFGRWGKFTEEAANLIVQVSKSENISPELLAITWMNESVFNMRPEPNTNKTPNDIQKWDIGPLQMNKYWTEADLNVKYYSGSGIDLTKVFGNVFYDANGNPSNFTGEPLENLRLGARKLKRLGTNDQERAVKYTGPSAREYRLKSWNAFSALFKEFFACYSGSIISETFSESGMFGEPEAISNGEQPIEETGDAPKAGEPVPDEPAKEGEAIVGGRPGDAPTIIPQVTPEKPSGWATWKTTITGIFTTAGVSIASAGSWFLGAIKDPTSVKFVMAIGILAAVGAVIFGIVYLVIRTTTNARRERQAHEVVLKELELKSDPSRYNVKLDRRAEARREE